MKNFFTVFFSTLLGVVISCVIVGVIFIAMLFGAFKDAFGSKEDKQFFASSNSILKIELNGEIKERQNGNPLANFSFDDGDKLSLNLILTNLKKAKLDSAIKGIYLQMGNPSCGFATTEEIRNALLDFKTTGKFIVAYGEVLNQKAYYLATVADKIFVNPQGGMELKGLAAQIMFYKKALENLNVEVQIFRHGKYKSAIEPFFLDKMSEANRQQTETFLGSIWASFTKGISKQRNISTEEINKMADNLVIQNTQTALANKLVDGLKYEDEVQTFLKEKIGLKQNDKISYVKMEEYKKSKKLDWEENTERKSKIAIIYAVGQIESGEGSDDEIGSDRISRTIREARLDTSIKAIVLRVNSPGGSALASDVMWREVVLAKKEKPFIVSMGDVAASGGYYIACAADRIFAEPNTITGSIGVFGIMPNAQKMLSEKLGITIDTVNTNKHADVGTMFRGVTKDERDYIQKSVEDVYQVFISRVAEGRKMSIADVDSIGQGRVWSGSDAIKIKLVDELGGIENAVKYAAAKAKLKEDSYSIVALPKKKNPLDKFLKEIQGDMETKMMSKTLGEQFNYIHHIKYLLHVKGVQARMPFDYIVY